MSEKAIQAALRKQFNSRLHGPEGGVLIFENELPKMAKEIADAILSSTAGQEWREPEGWKLAPIDPTPEMVAVCQISSRTLGPREVWRRMMSALPAPPVAEPLLADQRPETK